MTAPAPAETSLKALLEEGFCLLALLRAGAWPRETQGFDGQLAALLDRFEQRARQLGKPPEAVGLAKYAFCALADEILLRAESPLREAWERAPLQLRLFGEHLAGEGFFRRLDPLLQEPARHAELLEVFHSCLLLGFQGRYLLEEPLRLQELIERAGRELRRVRGEPGFAPQALPARFAAPGRGRVTPWGFAALLAGMALLIFLSFKVALRAQASGLARTAASRLP